MVKKSKHCHLQNYK